MKNNFQSNGKGRNQRVWQLLISMLIILTMGIGQMWATDTFVNLRTVDFTAMTKKIDFANGKNTISDAGYTDVEFYQKNTDKPLKLNNASGEGIDFSGQNIGNSHFVAIPLTGINGQLKVTVFHKYNSGKASFKLGLKTGTTTVTPGDYNTNAQTPKDGANADVSCSYTYGSGIIGTATTAVLFLGEAGSSYTQIKKVVIETLEASCTKPGTPATPAASDITQNSATLTWDPQGATAHSDGYKVSIVKKSDASVIVDWTENNTTSYSATGLTKGTTYTFKVKAVGATGYCEEGDVATLDFTTAAPTHGITYTNTKGAANSNPATYTEGVGIASFAKLRHVVGYDFTGWSPSSISTSANTDQTIDAQWNANAVVTGTGTLTYAFAFASSTITTSSITRVNGALYDATDVSTSHTSYKSGGEANNNGCSGKLTTTSAKNGENYVELTFKIADGYKFTPSTVSVKANAVSNAKTMEVELTDNAATPNTKSVTGNLAAGSTNGGVNYDLDFSSDPVTLEGTVTMKIYVYGSSGATDGWRLGTSIVITGTVAMDCTKPGTPANLAVSDKSHNSATFGWDAAANSNGYKVRLEQGSTVVVDWTDNATASYTASALTPETAYTFKVKAKGATGYCELGDEATVNVTTDAAPSANPVITGEVNETGWGTVSDAITVTSGKTVSIADNVLTCDEKTLTATATAATAEYTYAFAGWSGIANGDAVTANITVTANFTRTANNYELNWDSNGGSALSGTYTSGTVAYGAAITKPANPTRDGYKFIGWAESADGVVVEVPAAMPAADKTYYARWNEVNCNPGTIFSLEMKTGLSNEGIAAGGYKVMTSDYATVTGGSATLRNDGSDNTKARIYNSNIYLGGAAGYVVVELDCPLQVNDVIAFTGDNSNKICFTLTSTRATTYATTDGEFTVTSAFLNGNDNVTTIYVWRESGNGTTIHSLTVTRPAPDAPVPSITTDPVNASYTGSDPILPMTVVADATGAKDLHYQWYKVGDPSDVEVGDDAASYTPIASGEYYCVVTNSPTGYTAKSATSGHATITMVSSDATLAWLKADDNTIALTAGVYAYEYVLADNATEAPTITAGKNEEHATVTIYPADTKTGTATVHVVAEDGTTYHDYTVKFNEFVGCREAFWFAYATDAATAGKENNTTVFSGQGGTGTSFTNTFTVDGDDYEITKATSSSASFGSLTIPAGYNASVFVALKTSGSDRTVSLVSSAKNYTSDNLAASGYHVAEFTDVTAGTYTINVSSNSNFAMVKVNMCKYPVTGVSLPATESVYKDQSITLTPTFTPAEASNKNVTWTTSDASIATVENGVVTGKAAGTVNITVTTEDGGYQAVCAVTVSEIDCETYVGNLFSFEITATENKQYSSVGTGDNEKVIGDEVAAVAGGHAYAGYTNSTATVDVANKQSNVWYYKFSDSYTYLKVQLANCALRAGDVITMTALQDIYISTSATYPSNADDRIEIKHATDAKYMVKPGDVLEGQNTIYLWRKSGSTYVKNISIDRIVPFDANRTSLKVNSFGTFCYPQGVAEGMYAGATFYRILEKTGVGFVLEEVRSLVAGRPYMFVAEANTIYVVWNNDAVTAPVNDDLNYGLVGANFDDDYTPVPSYYDGRNCYILKNNHIYLCGNNCTISKYRAYIDYDAVPEAGQGTPGSAPAGAPALRRIVCGRDNATAIDNISENSDELTIKKVMIDGQMYILRGEKMYDATGRLVK